MSQDDFTARLLRQLGPKGHRAAIGTAAVAGVFCLVVAALLIHDHARAQPLNPVLNEQMTSLRRAFSKNENDEALKEKIRRLDTELRRTYLGGREFQRNGRWLLAGGGLVLLAALLYVAVYEREPPSPRHESRRGKTEARAAMFARWAVGVAALALAAMGWWAGSLTTPQTGPPPEQTARGGPALPPPVGRWPRFRGPGGRGISEYANVPMEWDGPGEKNILWKQPVRLPGQNSPIVWDHRVFLCGATKDAREVYCYDAHTGELLWTHPVGTLPGTDPKPPTVDKMTGYAAPTMATDGARVYAIFANADLVALDFDGNRQWAQNLGRPVNSYGHASSLTTHGSLLIVQFDQGIVVEDDLSTVMAFRGDSAGGDLAWETETRPGPNSWASPIIIHVGGKSQLITASNPWVIAYELAEGEELWRADVLEGDIGPSPTSGGGLVIACNTGADLVGIRPDGRGDVTKSKVVFRADGFLPTMSSPLSSGELIFLCEGTTLACHDAKTGKELWVEDERFEDEFRSSPALVGDKVYLMDTKGVTYIFRARRDRYEQLGTARLGEGADTCPAFVDGRIYIRGKKHLFCIGHTDGDR